MADADLAAAQAPGAAPSGYDFPALTGRVVDGANLLTVSQRRALSNRLVDAEKRSKHQFVVVTVQSLGGHVIEDYGLNLGRTWGIGRKCFNDGVLLIVAPNERKVRIEVGYGLEKALTDAEAKAVIDTDILPRFKAGDMPGGIAAGSEAIIREITQ
ncbi:TPM domain-containing protein [Sphingomonas sp. HITSZ_GF]|uniref:TPM domain-containing protein n=1 Tax=Sphingomonas sp. HITSZ_GF TaxID=3037247 RepID=UPI00240E4EA2|nr:TPM domain-containing protein [Sphingomonas sp. HITSZ_GF]MDG2533371.1 TPM domain-containing protein [Sphingomonas sp. HITSZ_GF]